jgi:hypothetical protein
MARLGQDDLKRVSESLPENFADGRLQRQIQVALAAYQAGLSVSVSVSMGGFDTHGNHDANHLPRLIDFVNGASFAMQEAERMGIADKVAVVMGSDFGRTPGYNNGNGKDHWPISSMMMMGPGIPGNRVIGGTDERHNLFLIDPVTLQATGRPDEASGTRLGIPGDAPGDRQARRGQRDSARNRRRAPRASRPGRRAERLQGRVPLGRGRPADLRLERGAAADPQAPDLA